MYELKARPTAGRIDVALPLRAPWPWYGSKLKVAELIQLLMGDINNLVIPFAGSLGELLGRSSPAKVETVNDLDGLVVNAWRAIKFAPEHVATLCDQPVHEVTLHAVHERLVRARTSKGSRKHAIKSGRRRTVPLSLYLRESEQNFDVGIAASWIWGASCWLGSGWCRELSRKRPALGGQGDRPHLGRGVTRPMSTSRKMPRVGGPGSGVGRPDRGRGVVTPQQMPHLSGSYTGHPGLGQGVHSGVHRDALIEWMLALAERLRFTRITCGDWSRVVTPAVTTSHGTTGISFDPPYNVQATGRSPRLYRKDCPRLSETVRAFAIQRGSDPLLRIILCGRLNEHDDTLEHGWSKHRWRDDGEALWASPHCARQQSAQVNLFGDDV